VAALAISAEEVGARVLILDLDAHCGGGTQSLVTRDPKILHVDVAVDSFDSYEPFGRSTLDLVTEADSYLPTIEQRLNRLTAEHFDLVLYNAGMDPCEDVPIGGLAGMTRDVLRRREALVFDWARTNSVPIAFVLAGGYLGPRLDADALVGLHRLTIDAAARSGASAGP
jgi:acetoin utilization deacetylase AcuC-like enzyme